VEGQGVLCSGGGLSDRKPALGRSEGRVFLWKSFAMASAATERVWAWPGGGVV
jgi:hypothetical protein